MSLPNGSRYYYNIRARNGVLMAVLLKIQVSCDVTQCRLVIADVSEECSAFMSGSSGSKMAALYIP
jgi:hypothetical protein